MRNEVKIPAPKVAILMASYNGTLYIKEQIESILKQRRVEVHLFISIDLSTDDTHEICNRYEQKNHKITVLKYGERFGGAGRNFYRLIRDVSFSNYDFVALSDQDDIWKPGKLFQAVNIMQNNELAAYSSDVIAFWSDGREKLVKKSYPQKEFDHYFESAGPGCSYVFKWQALQEFKDFLLNKWHTVNSIESHDWLIYAFFRSRNLPWCIDNKALIRYRQHESNQVGLNFGLKAYLKRINMIYNGWYHSEVEKIYNVIGESGCKVFNLERKFLISNFFKLRRHNRDAFILLFMVLFGIF